MYVYRRALRGASSAGVGIPSAASGGVNNSEEGWKCESHLRHIVHVSKPLNYNSFALRHSEQIRFGINTPLNSRPTTFPALEGAIASYFTLHAP
ncbi:LOW QUALITY PROTEIN: hypothetical protein BC938DRAFT_473658 [Jimgerdemannia flammicorona]|uniref:Uncharacterized protein n=1 Tax=Jimgerdemannia flammicorona TaxID=994334 RepID=A0A433Q3L9_9FUNG|nr:LOW QUALITY PROTEIN: hypothetical protein BC938DRAFT_473658 [Jimgerdemannia flammicorona]